MAHSGRRPSSREVPLSRNFRMNSFGSRLQDEPFEKQSAWRWSDLMPKTAPQSKQSGPQEPVKIEVAGQLYSPRIAELVKDVVTSAHPLANKLPMMSEEELIQQADQIRRTGQTRAVIWNGVQILDGRNRVVSTKLAGVQCIQKQLTDLPLKMSAVEYVLAENIYRRHLTTSQRSAIAAELVSHLKVKAKGRQGTRTDLKDDGSSNGDFGTSSEQAASMMCVSSDSVKKATRIKNKGTAELNAAVVNNRVSLNQADWIAKKPPEKQREILKDIKADKNKGQARKGNAGKEKANVSSKNLASFKKALKAIDAVVGKNSEQEDRQALAVALIAGNARPEAIESLRRASKFLSELVGLVEAQMETSKGSNGS